MDQRKAIFRAKLRETKEKQQRRIDPALVRSSFDSLSRSVPSIWLSIICRNPAAKFVQWLGCLLCLYKV
jgi:hypothetical protein